MGQSFFLSGLLVIVFSSPERERETRKQEGHKEQQFTVNATAMHAHTTPVYFAEQILYFEGSQICPVSVSLGVPLFILKRIRIRLM